MRITSVSFSANEMAAFIPATPAPIIATAFLALILLVSNASA